VRHIAELGPGDVAGEISLLTRGPASATVCARTRVWALGLARAEFNELIVTHPQVLIYVSEVAEQRRAATERLRLIWLRSSGARSRSMQSAIAIH
jgi:CRP-like cAMP-binding protein